MATYQITYWQEIPSQVEARDPGGKPQRMVLSQKFQELIDIVAVKRKLDSSDDYIAQWNKGAKTERAGDAGQVVRALVEELEGQYDEIRGKALQISLAAKS